MASARSTSMTMYRVSQSKGSCSLCCWPECDSWKRDLQRNILTAKAYRPLAKTLAGGKQWRGNTTAGIHGKKTMAGIQKTGQTSEGRNKYNGGESEQLRGIQRRGMTTMAGNMMAGIEIRAGTRTGHSDGWEF